MSRAVTRVAESWALAGGIILLAIMAITSVNVAGFGLDRLARLFGANISGLPGYEDVVRLSISSAALMFLPWCQAQRGHVTVDLFGRAMPGRVRAALDRLWLGGIVLLCIFLGYWMTIGMIETRSDNALSPVLGWPVWPFYLPGIVSLALWAAVAATQLKDRAHDA